MIPAVSDALGYLRQGGAVIIPLALVSVAMWYFILRKLALLWRYRPALAGEGDGGTDVRAITALVRRRQRNLERHVGTILVLAAVAPLLGLLGTVMGMIATFEAIARFGAANARAFAAGISEALITTQFGLVVAVPGLFMGHLIRRRVEALRDGWERVLIRRTVLAGAASAPDAAGRKEVP